MNWWPEADVYVSFFSPCFVSSFPPSFSFAELGLTTIFSSSQAFFIVAVPIMIAFEWFVKITSRLLLPLELKLTTFHCSPRVAPHFHVSPLFFSPSLRQHRQYFEPLLRITLGLRDLNSIPEFYSLSPSSSFFVYSHRSAIIGCIAIDAARPGEELESILGSEVNNTELEDKKALEESKGTSNSVVASKSLKKRGANTSAAKNDTILTAPLVPTSQARIRHFHVDLLYRNATTSADLLEHALQHTFTVSKQVDEIFAIDTPTKQKLGAVLKKEGFEESWSGPKGAKGGKKFGIFGLEEKWVSLEREGWEKKNEVVKA